MIHILLLILKIIGIILLAVLVLAFLILFFPITYIGKTEFEGISGCGTFRAHWLFHILHFRMKFQDNDLNYVLRVFGVPVILSKKKKHSEKKTDAHIKEKNKKDKFPENDSNNSKVEISRDISQNKKEEMPERTSEVQEDELLKETSKEKIDEISDSTSEDKKNTGRTGKNSNRSKESITGRIKKRIQKIKKLFKDFMTNTKSAYNKLKEIKTFITANTTKEAYHYGKRLVIKLIQHIFPKRIRGNITFGFDEPHMTGQVLGYIAMAYGTFGINPEKMVVYPDFEKKVFRGEAKCKGYVFLGVVGIYILKFYFKKEIRDIIEKFN